ncbi:topless-related protein 2-like isoform X2 [Diospyros lotus]|uniref:topless-related protein 2-like isoform X2 n=1 Tax=Diospyros lotus TaxID=55363 RepID=UPI00224E5413|nr:topless-related protein 2-like isoform X2 [Diospyros lotus]
MSSLSRELVFLILQFLDEEKFKESVHKLEQESGLFFNMKYFEEKVLAGEWEEVEIYLSGFTKLDDNRYSMKIYFEIRKQKYLEALDRHDRAKAVDILVQDLKVFSAFNEELYKEITLLLTLENFRENEQLSKYGDTKTARSMMLAELKKLFEANPLFREKLVFPTFKASRLRNLINQSLNWQHQLCKNPKPNPDIKTLFTDHTCSSPNGARVPSPVTLPIAAVSKPAVYGLPGALSGPFQTVAGTPSANALAGWLANANASSSVQTALIAASALSVQPNQASTLKQARTPSPGLQIIDYQSNGQEQLMKRLHSAQSVEEVSCPANSQQSLWSLDNLPRNVARTIHQGSTVTSMDFHPFHHTLLIVGCANGEIALWEVVLQERLLYMPFKIWNVATVSKDLSVSVNRVAWSPEGSFIGIAFSKHLIHLYAHQAPHTLRQHIEIEAHAGGVNDLAFSSPYKQLCVVTCGDDKLIKVWTLTGRKLYVFEGHAAPVYSVCPHLKENIHFIFSTDIDGKIKAWLYDNAGSRVDYDAPGQGCTTMLYSTDGSRLFSCGTNKEGDSFLVEWNESEGSIKRTYSGFRKKAAGVVKVDTTQNQFLAAGEDNQIKFWDMDNTSMLASTDAEGELLSFPYLKFNKEGNLLAVTAENGFKILANAEGLRYLKASERRSYEISRAPADPSLMKSGIDVIARSTENSRALEDVSDKTKSWVLAEIVDPVQCQSVSMPDSGDQGIKVSRLVYTNLGTGILALGSNGVQKLWKWSSSEHNPRGKATAGVVPQHWQPNSGLRMINDVPDSSEEKFPCLALSKNDSYVMSACGGKISLFNMMTFKVMTTFMPPPPVSTFLAFHPQDNNIIAIGMEDSTVHIYNVRVDEVKTKLKGHEKRITSLAFSTKLNILVSAGTDAKLCFWNTDTWDKRESIKVQLPAGKEASGDTRVQFHFDQLHLLVSHETQIAVYDASKMVPIRQWVPQDGLTAPITHAAYSCDSQLVYAAFTDGNIGVFDAEYLRLRCRMAPSAYLSQTQLKGHNVYPLVVAAHPDEPNQFAVGLTDGTVQVLEPSASEGKWGIKAPANPGTQSGRTMASSATSNPSN